MYRIISMIIGYALGNILTAEFVARKYAGKSSFEIGSRNPGMANVMAQCGFKPGIMVLTGDLLKTFLACILCGFVLFRDYQVMATAWAGLGAVIGHNYPVWHRFRGGKGVSSTCAVLFCINPLLGLAAMIIGMLGVFVTQYLPVGGVLIPLAFIPIGYFRYGTEMALIAVILTIVMIIRNIPGFRGMKSGAEKKINVPGLIYRKLLKRKKEEEASAPLDPKEIPDALKTQENAEAADAPKTEENVEAAEAPKTQENVKAADAPKTQENAEAAEAPENEENAEAARTPEVKE